ncbi:sensor histidine kinase [Roseivirga thermotolerans]|uniref:sensor histidine kinase n=1 Tax=Roseivirga thermotolerans TaxID=1758176 RepID=UPI00273FABC6|nr:ATP-binding protein [Roseivirga thermotolerans]
MITQDNLQSSTLLGPGKSSGPTREVQLSLFMILVVFAVDLIIPLGVAVGILYVCSMAVILSQKPKTLLYFSILISILIWLIPLITFNNQTTWMAFANRGISTLAIWVMYIIGIRHSRLNLQVQKHNRELAHKNKELEQFTYVASHDLQEPLRTVTNFTKILVEDYGTKLDDTGKKSLKFISESATRMRQLVKDLLDYSRIGQERQLTMVDCHSLLVHIQKDLSSVLESTHTTLVLGELPEVRGYQTELRLLFQNLISNAIKFRKKEVAPQIQITAKEDNGWVFAIQDNGIGISKKHQEKIFTIFQRIYSREAYEGTGIGLAHCRKIAEVHKGRIWVESEPDQGSTFYFYLPKL